MNDGPLETRFHVERIGGDRPDAAYFVLDYGTDPYARAALAAYADACAEQYPQLAADLRARSDRADHGLVERAVVSTRAEFHAVPEWESYAEAIARWDRDDPLDAPHRPFWRRVGHWQNGEAP